MLDDLPKIDVNATIRDLMEPAKVALGPGMPSAEKEEAILLLSALLGTIERLMPPDLLAADQRIGVAKSVLRFLTN